MSLSTKVKMSPFERDKKWTAKAFSVTARSPKSISEVAANIILWEKQPLFIRNLWVSEEIRDMNRGRKISRTVLDVHIANCS